MAKQKVIILGSTGMLGSMVLDLFARSGRMEVVATYRNKKGIKFLKKKYPKVDFRQFDTEKMSTKSALETIKGTRWIVNAIGVIKPYIHDNDASEIHRAIWVNAHFTHLLAQIVSNTNSRVIQIATDCVYSGQKGGYLESDPHDALDVYGKTKSLGEVFGDNFYHLRCSIIGPEQKGHNSLLDWFLSMPKNAEVNGFTNHKWNGVTTLHFARICHGIIKNNLSLPHIQHIIPKSAVTKSRLLKHIAKAYNRKDIIIKDMEAPMTIDRTLSTKSKSLNQKIWKLAGYGTPPTISKMVGELSQYKFL